MPTNLTQRTVFNPNTSQNETNFLKTESILTGDQNMRTNPGMCRHYGFLLNTYLFLYIFSTAITITPKTRIPFLLIPLLFQSLIALIDPISNAFDLKALTLIQYFASLGIGASALIWGKN